MTDQNQLEIISLEELVPEDSDYRKFVKLFNFKSIEYRLKKLEKDLGRTGYGMMRLFKCLPSQFMEDLSDRELEECLKINTVSKWFCGFGLKDKVPNYSLFSQVRDRIGTDKLSKLFNIMKDQLKKQGYMSEVFTFVIVK